MPKDVVEKSGLPMGLRVFNSRRYRSFQQSDRCAEFVLSADPDKYMNMIGHDDIATESRTVIARLFSESLKFLVRGFCREDRFPVEG
ncbi:hypothetical protein PDESU_04870 [Pontiella desulfatans]|uniref:Uncharacterized protein n=1 Tax=Pontiella desulfatans TaxID=2750659 RepID=A0A6C2U8S4_PONDE|nr:hypothetical protein PDESU_04870 [Pontiella desulfatans]